MSGAPSPSASAKRIASHLYRIPHQHFFRTFEDWLALAVNAFLRDDDAYMAIMARYGPREQGTEHAADHFARALGAWMLAMQESPADYLGLVYEQEAVANSYAGQFFTPESVTEVMAQMTMPDTLPDNALVCDPACGSGRTLIAGIRRNRFATFMGVDTDVICVHMATLNCLVHNANSTIIHGNSLSLEAQGGFHVRQTAFGGELYRLTKEQADELIRLPFRKGEHSTALSPVAHGVQVQPATPEVEAALDQVTQSFGTDTRGQGEFGF